MTARARFTEKDIARLFKGAKAAGYARVRVGIDPTGNIVCDASDEPEVLQPIRVNPLDRLLGNR